MPDSQDHHIVIRDDQARAGLMAVPDGVLHGAGQATPGQSSVRDRDAVRVTDFVDSECGVHIMSPYWWPSVAGVG